ncbi:MAG: hypothetical protein AB7U83_10065 [Vicinamibacterales bacterium]
MRALVLCALVAGAAGCAAEPGTAPVGMAPSVTVTVSPITPDGPGPNGPPTLEIPRDAAQIGVRLLGAPGEVEHLTAEMAPAQAPDEVRRWRVDVAPTAADGATAMVTLPPHAVPDGDYVLTLWEGDARVVARYGFRTVKR